MHHMTPRECVIIALRREEPERLPFEISFGIFTPHLMDVFVEKTGSTDPADYFNFPVRSVMHRYPNPYELWQTYGRYYPERLPVGATISWVGAVYVPGSTLHFTKNVFPLCNATSVEEIMAYPLPDPHNPYYYTHLKKSVEDLHREDLAAQGELTVTIFEIAWSIRGLEQTLTDFILNPDMVDALFERLTEMRLVQVRQLVSAGIDILRLGDDVSSQKGMLMSPLTWRRFLKPRLKRIIDEAKNINKDLHIFYHSDGNCTAIVPDLIEIGVNILNPVQPECMDPVGLKKQFGDRLAFWGTVGTQSTMPFGKPEDVRRVVRERIETVGKGGGLLIAPTHILEPEVPWENVTAFIEAVREFGNYC